MPYIDSMDTYINPYYLDVNPLVRQEMYTRAQYYGAYTRTAINEPTHIGLSNSVEWPYQKMPWAYVISETLEEVPQPIVLGFDISEKDGIKQNSDKDGNLTLYESQRNVPKYPLLTYVEISNEGLRGSLLKGKFGFTFFPNLYIDGFDLLSIQRIFFTPGMRVNIGFGWSVAAANIEVNQLEFTGIIYGFNWNYNQNHSITAEVQIISPAALSVGLSGEQTVFDAGGDAEIVGDPSGQALPAKTNILSIMERDIRAEDKLKQDLYAGDVMFVPRNETSSKIFDYFQIGLPISYGSSYEDASVDRVFMDPNERLEEERRKIEQEIEEQIERLQPAIYNQIEDPTKAGENIIPPGEFEEKRKLAESGAINKTPGQNNNQAGSNQMFMFLEAFKSNKGEINVDKPESNWLIPWQTKFAGSSFGRYVWPDNTQDFNSGYWESSAQKNWSEFFNELQNTQADKREEYIKRQIATLAYLELEELKNAMFYSRNPENMQLTGGIGRGNKKIQFFWADNKDKTVKKDDYFWPDNLKFVYTDGSKFRYIDMKSMYDTFNGYTQTKELREKYKNNEIELLKQFHNPLHKTNGADQIEKRINGYLNQLKYYAENAKKLEINKTGLDSQIDDKNPNKQVTDEQIKKLNKEIKELRELQEDIRNGGASSALFTDPAFKKDFDKKYPDNKIVGGVDIKTLKDNWLIGYVYDGKWEKIYKDDTVMVESMKGAEKAGYIDDFLKKVIQAKENEKGNGKDETNDLMKTKSSQYRDLLNSKKTDTSKQTSTDSKGKNDNSGTGEAAQQYQSQVVARTYRYITLANLAEFANDLIKKFEEDLDKTKYHYRKFKIQCDNNETEYQPDIKSANPVSIYFPDISMGAYHSFNPFYDNEYSDYLRQFSIPQLFQESRTGTNVKKDATGTKIRIEDDVINIGHILIGIDLIIRAYREFILDNATNIAYKNITSFFDYIIREINAASGDTYQLTTQLFTEPEKLSPKLRSPNEIGTGNNFDLLSIEDTNIARKHTQTYPADDMNESVFSKEYKLYAPDPDSESLYDLTTTIPFTFEGSIFKPLIKNVQIASRPPKELAYAAYVAARGQEAHAKGKDIRAEKSKPYSGDATVMNPYYRDEDEYKKQREENNINKKNEEELSTRDGFNEKWSDQYRALLVKYKRLSSGGTYVSGRNFKVGSHWLNKAIYPVEFTVTIDGINGFKFGDVLKTTMIPEHYNVDWDMVFTVTKILHKVTPSSWETTLNTAARLSLESTQQSDETNQYERPPKEGPDTKPGASRRGSNNTGNINDTNNPNNINGTNGTDGIGSNRPINNIPVNNGIPTSDELDTLLIGTGMDPNTNMNPGNPNGSFNGATGTDLNFPPNRDDLEYMKYQDNIFDNPNRIPDNFG